MGYIPKHALNNLLEYKYNGVDRSLTSKYILNPFWNQFVKLWPNNVAPNVITFTGLCFVLVNFATLLYFDPQYLTPKQGAEETPNWLFYTWGAGLFIYQTLDAIDGKQARRTKMSGPLGEMFDHGCDALNTTLEVILACYALNLGRSWWTVASQLATLANFYLTTWEEFHTGRLYLGVFSGPVEGILMIVGIYLVSGTYGASSWDKGILTFLHLGKINVLGMSIPDLPLNEAFMVFGALGLAFNITTSYLNVYRDALQKKTSALTPLARLLPFPLSASFYLLWLSAPFPGTPFSSFSTTPSRLSEDTFVHSSLFLPLLCAWGLQFAHQVGRMILAHLVKDSRFPWAEPLWIATLIGGIDAQMPVLFGRPPIFQSTATRSAIAVTILFILSLVSYARFCTLVIIDITDFLGIACFTVRKRDTKGIWRAPSSTNVHSLSNTHTNGNGHSNGYSNGHGNGHSNGNGNGVAKSDIKKD